MKRTATDNTPSYILVELREYSIDMYQWTHPEHAFIITTAASNWVLRRMKPSRWLPAWVAIWGVVTTLSGLVQSFGGLIAIRFFLGFCEGGLLPGIVSGDLWGIDVWIIMASDVVPEYSV